MSWSLPVSINPKPLSVSRLMVPSGIFQSPQKVSSSVQKNAVVTLGLGSDLTRASRRRRPAAHDPSCDARTGLSYGPSRLRSRHKLSRNSRRFDAHIAVPVPDRGGWLAILHRYASPGLAEAPRRLREAIPPIVSISRPMLSTTTRRAPGGRALSPESSDPAPLFSTTCRHPRRERNEARRAPDQPLLPQHVLVQDRSESVSKDSETRKPVV